VGIFSVKLISHGLIAYLLEAGRHRLYEGDLTPSISFFVVMALAMLVVLMTGPMMSRTGITNNYIIVLTEVAVIVLRVATVLVVV